MQNQQAVLILIVIALVGFGCKTAENTTGGDGNSGNSYASPSGSSGVPSLTEDVFLTISLEEAAKQRPIVAGETNLPDGTSLLISVEGRSSKFVGQSDATVESGKFQAGPFGPTEGLPNGQYSVNVTMPIARLQSEAVRAVIGQNGENLKGSLVDKSDLGVSVRTESEFSISAAGIKLGETDSKQVQAALAEAAGIFKELKTLEQQGRSMESLRRTDDLKKVGQCGELMRARQSKAKELQSRAEKLPRPYGFLLAVAAGEMSMCIVCSDNAIESCNLARNTLMEAEQAIKSAK